MRARIRLIFAIVCVFALTQLGHSQENGPVTRPMPSHEVRPAGGPLLADTRKGFNGTCFLEPPCDFSNCYRQLRILREDPEVAERFETLKSLLSRYPGQVVNGRTYFPKPANPLWIGAWEKLIEAMRELSDSFSEKITTGSNFNCVRGKSPFLYRRLMDLDRMETVRD